MILVDTSVWIDDIPRARPESLWTLDRRLRAIAAELGIAHVETDRTEGHG